MSFNQGNKLLGMTFFKKTTKNTERHTKNTKPLVATSIEFSQ